MLCEILSMGSSFLFGLLLPRPWVSAVSPCAPITDHPSDQLQLCPDSVSLASANILGSGPADMHAMVDDMRQPLLTTYQAIEEVVFS